MKRTRNWATIIYPESAPENWKDILEDLCIPALVSPLHDKDMTDDGELKKEHYHIMLMFEGVKTTEQVKELFAQIGGVGTEPINCAKAYTRYLCHLDNPDKVQYNPDDILYLSGADYDSMIRLTINKYTAISEMIDFCIQNNVDGFATLIIYAKDNRKDWFQILCDNGTLPIVQFLKSRYWEVNHDKGGD